MALQPCSRDPMLQQRLCEISGAASQALDEVRQITHGLRPYQLDRLGLTLAVRAIVNRASENSQILFAGYVDDVDGLFDKESEIHVYRIIQEGVNNVFKHSNATEAAVVVKRQEAGVTLSIRDNGRGFDTSMMSAVGLPEAGFGLNGIGERVRILNGKFSVDSRPGQGAILNVELPAARSKHEARSEIVDRG
jgi:signal transduction histidine kinase